MVLAIVQQLLSMIWYSPQVWGFKWMRLSGFSPAAVPEIKSFAFYVLFILSLAASLLLAYAILWLWRRLKITTALDGFKIATMGWLLTVFMFTLVHHRFANTAPALTLIDTIRDWMVFASSGAVLAVWGYRYEHK